MFGRLEKWRPVKEILDFSDEGTSIFREKPLAEKDNGTYLCRPDKICSRGAKMLFLSNIIP